MATKAKKPAARGKVRATCKYKTAKHPATGKWIVIGHCGGRYWMPVSSGFKTDKEATARVKHLYAADRAARRELYTV